jgi:hypothetical protein
MFHQFFFTEVRGAASNSAHYGYPELWILRYPPHRYHAMSSSGFEPTTLWSSVKNGDTGVDRDKQPWNRVAKC